MKKLLTTTILLLIATSSSFAITYRRPVTAHQQLTSTGTLTHADLESTLTAVNAATTTLKGITDAHAATLAQVGVATETLAGLVGSGAGDNLGNHVATTTLNMNVNVIDGVTRINTPFDNDLGWYKPLIIGGDTSQGFATGVRVINYNSPSYMGNSELTMQWLGNPFLYFNDGGWNSYFKGIYYYDPTVSNGTPALNISSNNVVMFGNCTAPYFYGDVSGCTGFPAASPSYWTVSPSSGIDAGPLADGVKVTTANVTASGTADGTTFLRGDGAWATPSGSGDMVQATHGVAIAESTTTLASMTPFVYDAPFAVKTNKSITFSSNTYLTVTGAISFRPSLDGTQPGVSFSTVNGIRQNVGGGIAINSAMTGVPFSAKPIELNGSSIRMCWVSTITDSGAAIFAGSVTASSFYGDGSNLTGITAAPSYFTVSPSTGIDAGTLADAVKVTTANISATGTSGYLSRTGEWADLISVSTVNINGTPALDGYPVSVNGDVLISSGVLYLRNSQLLMAHPDGETSVYLLSTDSDSYNADILMQSGSTLTVTGSGGNKANYVQNGNITCDYIQGDGSRLTGLAGGGDMVQATHGVAIGASTATLRTDVTALQQSTGTLQADLATEVSDRGLADAAIGVTTGTLRTDVTAIGVSTAAIKTILTQVQTDTGTIKTQVTSIGASTATLRTDLSALAVSTGAFKAVGASTATLRTDITTLWTATGTLKAQIAAVAQSTGTFATVANATATLRTDLTAVKQSTGAVGIGAHFIVYGNTQTFVTNLSTQPICQTQSAPLGAFTISSATARIVEGTSATIRLFITAKNNEYSIATATPIWGSAVTAGANYTGGTLSNVSVGVDNAITVVIDAIAGAVKYMDISVRGNR